MKKFLRTLMLAAMFLPFVSQAQLSAVYQFSTGIDNTRWYTLTSDSVMLLDAASFTTSTTATTGDSKRTDVTNIGFSFYFAGTNYTQFSVNSDGTVRLGATQVGTGSYTTPFSASNANTNAPKICGLGCDGCMVYGDYIAYQLFGTEGSRVAVIEVSTGTYTAATRDQHYTFQVQFSEADSSVTLVYSPTAPTTNPATTYQLGACASATDIVLFDVATSTMSAHTAGTSTNNASGTWPAAGRYYTITPDANACFPVTALTVSNVTTSDVTLTWADTLNSGATYTVYNGTTAVATGITATTYTVTGLTANTVYTFNVEANCSSDNASNATTITARTACNATTSLPYVEEFNGYTGLPTYPYYGPSTTPACWLYYSNGTNTAETSTTTAYYGGVASYNGTSYGSMESNNPYLYLPIQLTGSAVTSSTALDYDEARGNVRIAAMPAFTEALNSLQISFDYKMSTAYSATGAAATLEFGYVYGDDITFVSLQSYQAVTTTQHVVDLNLSTLAVGAPAGSRLAFKFSGVHNGTSTSSYSNVACGIDNIVVTTLPTCLRTTNLAVSNITSHAVTLTWADTLNTGATYTVYDMDDTTVIATGITAMTYTVTGLDANTDYTFGVVANCSATDASAIASISARTSCEAEVLPFIEDFSASLTNNVCWRGATGTTAAQVFAGATLNLTTPNWTFVSSARDGLDGGHYYKNVYGTSVKSWMITPAIDLTSLDSAQLSFDVALTDYNNAALPDADGDTNTSQVFYVIVSTDGGNTWLESNATKWQNVGGDYTYASLASLTYQNKVIDLTQYIGNTIKIAFYCQSLWSGGDNDLHIDNIAVTGVSSEPSCTVAIPYTEDFDTTSAYLGCWTVADIAGNTGLTTSYPYSGDFAFRFAYNTNPPQYLISPELSGTEDGVAVSFMYRTQSSNYPESFQLGYSTTTNDTTAFTWLAEQTNLTNLTYQQYSQILPAGVKYVSIKYTANDMFYLYIDSVVFNLPPSCLPVADLAVDSVTATSVFLSWTGNASSYSIYSSTGAVVATGITTTSYEVTGLTPSTSYTFGVIANCGSDNSEAVIITAVTECGGTTCFVEINGTDSYGDGWNGNAINLIQNGAVIHTFTLTSGSTLSEHITVCGDFPVNFAWVAGSYASEVFFELKDASGMVVYTCNDATALTDDTVFYTLTTVCPSCAAPVITVDNATETSITISWTGNAASYDVYNGSTYVASVTTNTYTFTGLSTATTYTFGVQAICSTTDSSALNSITVMTSCGDITTLPYFEGFENGLGCWTTVNGSSDGQPWSVNNCAGLSTVDPHGGNYVASSWSWSSSAMHADAWLISPKFILPSNVTDSLMFSWWEIANANYPDSYSVLISTSTSDTSAFTVIRPSTAAAGTWTMQSIDLTSYAGQSVYVAFHHVDYDENYLLIDDITLSLGGAPVITDSAHITIAVNDPTMGTTIPAPGTYAYADGEEFTITAVPANGYQLLDWAVTVTYDGETETEYLGTTDLTISDTAYAYFDMLNLVVTAIFGTDSIDPNADSMLVNIAVNDPTMGTTNPAPGAHYFHVGEQASVVAIPNTGYHLEGWTVNVTIEGYGTVMDTTLPYAVNDFFDLWGGWEVEEGDGMYTWNVTANFAAGSAPETNDSLTVITSVNNAAWGTVTPAPGTHYYTEGQTFTMGAAPNEGYYIYAVYTTVTMPGFGTISDTAYAEDLEIEMGQPLYDEVEVDEDMIGMVIELHVVFASLQGIENAEEVNVNVYGNEGDIVLQGAEGREVYVFDVNGRMLHHTATANMTERYSVPATGVYLVKVEGVVTKRVVIVR